MTVPKEKKFYMATLEMKGTFPIKCINTLLSPVILPI